MTKPAHATISSDNYRAPHGHLVARLRRALVAVMQTIIEVRAAGRVPLRRSTPIMLAALSACGPAVEEPEEPIVVVEHRVEPCTVFCESVLDAECGEEERDPPRYDNDVDRCVELCADVEIGFDWGRVDGEDHCIDEWAELVECIPTMSCEESRAMWNDPHLWDGGRCQPEHHELNRCSVVNVEPQEDS